MSHHSTIEIAVSHGDGIGPEIMKATLACLHATGAPLAIREIEAGEKVYLQGELSGIAQESWEVLQSTKAFLKAPITTPQGGGFRSLNVTIRGALGLYANIRPCIAYAPFIPTKHPGMDVIIIRENEEDLYAGIEYNLSRDTKISLKLATEMGCRNIVQYAFDYAVQHNRKKVSCFTKDNIMKLTDGMFHKVFDEIRAQYPSIESDHFIVDIGAAKLADKPNQFDVVVLPNLYGDILSDVAAQIAGSVGIAGSANIGRFGAMFEAIHGSAPKRAGQNAANPSGLFFAAIMMLNYLTLNKEAELFHNAWLATIEEGVATYDIYQEGPHQTLVGTAEFAQAVIQRFGKKPSILKPATYVSHKKLHPGSPRLPTAVSAPSATLGAHIYIEAAETHSDFIDKNAKIYKQLAEKQELAMPEIFSRGSQIWPRRQIAHGMTGNILRLSFVPQTTGGMDYDQFQSHIANLQQSLQNQNINVRAVIYL